MIRNIIVTISEGNICWTANLTVAARLGKGQNIVLYIDLLQNIEVGLQRYLGGIAKTFEPTTSSRYLLTATMSQEKDEGDIKIVFKLHDSQKDMHPELAGDMVSKVLTEALVILQALFANYRPDIGIDFNGNALFISVVDGIDNAGINNIELTDDDRHIDYTVHFTHKKLGDVIVDIIRELSIAVEGAINQFKFDDVLRFSILTETGLFINNHSPCDSHFLLKSLDFCSVVHYSQILMHRHVVPLTEDQLNREYGIGYIVDYPDPKMLGMQVSFEHDRRLLFITFAFKRSGRGSRVIHVIKLQIKYSSIQQIFSAVHVIKLHADKPKEQKLEHNEEIQRSRSRKKGERCATWDDSDPYLLDDINGSPLLAIHFQDTDVLECSKLLGRLESCLNITIECRRFNVPTDPTFSLYAVLQGTKEELRELSKNYSGHINEKYELMFMFEALFCRGGAYLINDRYRTQFLKEVLYRHFYNKDATLSVLESIVNTLDEHKEVMITPSRMILFPPEMLMSNRVFRYNPTKYPPSSFLRVIFRDEDWSRVHKKNVTFKLVNQFIGERLKSGFEIVDCLITSAHQIRSCAMPAVSS
ncbi:RNA dependent RNA polymerase domain-containing protein [Ditylenchus destructor]|nr:RNA dependent RNA polymerase domain-containing protein [Ditylenchus destructor]